MNRFKKYGRRVLAGAVAVAPGLAMAQTGPSFDTTTVTTAIAAAAVAVGLIGAAVAAGPVVVKAAWGWIKGAIGR